MAPGGAAIGGGGGHNPVAVSTQNAQNVPTNNHTVVPSSSHTVVPTSTHCGTPPTSPAPPHPHPPPGLKAGSLVGGETALTSARVHHNSEGGFVTSDGDPVYLCSTSGLRNLSGLVFILKEDLNRSVRKSKRHALKLLDILYCRIRNRNMAHAFYSMDNFRYVSRRPTDADARPRCSYFQPPRATVGG